MEKRMLVDLGDVLKHLDSEIEFCESMRQMSESRMVDLVLDLDLSLECVSESDRIRLQECKTRIELYKDAYDRMYNLKCRLQTVSQLHFDGGEPKYD